MNNNSVEPFMERLQKMSLSTPKKVVNRKLIEKLFCNFKGNFGRYQILPFNSVITNFPYVVLGNTREIRMPRKNLSTEGVSSEYNAWIRLLPMSAYTIKDPSSGREVSSLTETEESLLRQAYSLFDELFVEVDAKTNAMDPTIKEFIRRKNYTIFHGYCINKWEGDSRTPAKEGFSALFVVTAKNFIDLVKESMSNTAMTAMTPDWQTDIYNNETSNRKGFLLFSINKADGPGFNVNINHQLQAENYLSGVTIPEEDAELMVNPVETFLGWQANRDDETPVQERRLFNKALITEAIEFMTNQLAQIRMAKKNNTSIQDAIKTTNQMVLENQNPTNSHGIATNDPILAEMSGSAKPSEGFANNPNLVTERNDKPFQTPPAAKLDPITGAPVVDGNNTVGNPNPSGVQWSNGWSTNPNFNSGNNQQGGNGNVPF